MVNDWIVVYGQGIDIYVHNDRLVIRHGFRGLRDWQNVEIERGTNRVNHLIILAYSGKLSVDAIRWMMSQDITVTFWDDFQGRKAIIQPVRHISPVVKRRQATAGWTISGPIATELLSGKLRAEIDTLQYVMKQYGAASWWTADRMERIDRAAGIIRDRAAALHECHTPDEMRMMEAQAAAAYWSCYDGIPLAWKDTWKTPRHWLAIGSRTSPKSGGPRKAIDPFHALLNYSYAIVESMVERECLFQGIDPDFGILHADRRDRASLVFDLMEPIRPTIDRAVFNFMVGRRFDKNDFFQTPEGICRVSPNISSEIIPKIKDMATAIRTVVASYAVHFKNRAIIEKPVSIRNTRPNAAAVRREAGAITTNRKQAETRRTCAAPDCGREFIPRNGKQLYCSYRCRDREKARRYRQERAESGRCIQCGGPMDFPPSLHHNKTSPRYCSRCQEYFRKRYIRSKAR